MNWQEILVMLAVGGAIAFAIWRIIRFFIRVSKNENSCDSCDADCALRDLKKTKGNNTECPDKNSQHAKR